jgi:hypothetical protein
MKILNQLLHIKEFRENKAEMEVMRVRHALYEAELAVEHARNALTEYRAMCVRKERELYADLCSRLVHLTDFDDVALEVDNMRQGIERYKEEVTTAENNHKATAERLERAKEAHRIAIRMREKFTELVDNAKEGEALEQQRVEDAEMEEVSGTRTRRASDTSEEADQEEAA